jgi:hypothetical protein
VRLRRRLAPWALALLASAAPSGAPAEDAVRVQAEGAAALPALKPGAAPPPKPDAAALRALRQTAIAHGIGQAVLAHAAQLARPEVRDDEAALRAALGADRLADYALGHGVLGEIGPRATQAKRKPGDPPPKPRRPADPISMEHAWRVEVLVDGARVRAALEAAGLVLVSRADSGAASEVVLEAPYDAAMLAALRARLVALGGSAVPRRYEAASVTLSVRGLPPALVRERLASDPPLGYAVDVAASGETPASIRVRLRASPPASARQPARGGR